MSNGIDGFSIPEWVTKDVNFAEGLDLLGLRNVAQSISNYCLNGITTISPKIRYLGIRSWILQMYARCELPDDYSTFLNFGAKLEGAIAIGSLLYKSSMLGVVGSTKASVIIEESDSIIEIKRLVQQLVLNIYTGPSTDLGIAFRRKSGITGLTKERGELIANSIMRKVSETNIVKKILTGKKVESFTRTDLIELGKILSIDKIPADERKILLDIIIPKEQGPLGWVGDIRRIATYTLLLQQAKEKNTFPSVDCFFEEIIKPSDRNNPHLTEIFDGWLCYLIRDSLAVAHEKSLEVIIDELEVNSNKYFSRSEIINLCINDVNSIESELRSLELFNNDDRYNQLHFFDIYNKIDNLLSISDDNSILQKWNNPKLNEQYLIKLIQGNSSKVVALLPIVWILSYFRLNGKLHDGNSLIARLSRGGWGRIGIKEVIFPTIEKWKIENPTFHQIIFDLLNRTIDQHVRISWSRMAADLSKDVSVLKVDANKLQFRKRFSAGRTQSRLNEAIGWLEQLQLIDVNGITNKGAEALAHGYNSLKQYYMVNE